METVEHWTSGTIEIGRDTTETGREATNGIIKDHGATEDITMEDITEGGPEDGTEDYLTQALGKSESELLFIFNVSVTLNINIS